MGPAGRRAARVLGALAVLIGLFGMHGLATAQAGGCHAGNGMVSAPAAVTAPMTRHWTDVRAAAQPRADTMMGGSCLFVPPQPWPSSALALLALVVTVPVPRVGGQWVRAGAPRAPPDSGVSVLHRVCVSRT